MKNITDLLGDEYINEMREYYEIPDDETFEDYFELNNKIFIGFEDGDINDQQFYFGPGVTENAISDTIYLDGYLNRICKKLSYKVDIQLMENVHMFFAPTTDDFRNQINQLISYVKNDGYEVYNLNNE